MIEKIKDLLGIGPKPDYSLLIKEGAIVIDVRTTAEFAAAHLKQARNIPLQTLPSRFGQLEKNKTIIVCCASGMRSASAKKMLDSNGFKQVYNGGAWTSLRKYME